MQEKPVKPKKQEGTCTHFYLINVFLQCKLTEGQHTGTVRARAASRDAANDGTEAGDGTRAELGTGTAPAQLLEGFRVEKWVGILAVPCAGWLFGVVYCPSSQALCPPS